MTVTASDPGGLSATQSISVTVEAVNQAPVAEGTIDDLGWSWAARRPWT